MIMATNGHSREQGLRVHHLANLGGLIALAGLDREPPDFLLGALISVAQESANLPISRFVHLALARIVHQKMRVEREPHLHA